ncbi:MAG: ABC transporter permease [Oscillospiraceae bacterium]|nr:ABC transporter permease [Oscillospiraceae bacterium]
MEGILNTLTNFISADFRTAVPLLLCALGLVFSERAGIVNIAAEGLMLIAAVSAAIGSAYLGPWGGALLAGVSGLAGALIFAFFTITLRANQIVVGTAFNIFAAGLSVTLNRRFLSGMTVTGYSLRPIPGLSQLPILGDLLFNWQLLVYLTFLAVPLLQFMLYRSNLGLKIRATGEQPRACDSVGIKVNRVRTGVVLFSGILAGLAGSYVSLGQASTFIEGMVAGKGFMALAVCVFGNYTPIGALGAALLFGAADALKYRLLTTALGSYYQFLNMLPYAITVVSLMFLSRHSNKPAASGKPYIKE